MSISRAKGLNSALDGVGDKGHAPAALPPGKTRYTLYRRLGAEYLAPTGILSPDHPARIESPYRLRCADR